MCKYFQKVNQSEKSVLFYRLNLKSQHLLEVSLLRDVMDVANSGFLSTGYSTVWTVRAGQQ